ncbi:MAG: phosphoglycolate phosphatase [Alphaproteobacteria bacterium]
MKAIQAYDAVVFDLDGTLIDSAPDIRVAINRVLAEDGLAPLDLPLVTSFIGNGVAKLVERAYRHRQAPLAGDDFDETVARFADSYARKAAVLSRTFPGVIEGLNALKADGLRLGICTNKPEALSRAILDQLGLAVFFDVVIGGDSCAAKKPDPAPLLACLDTLAVDPGQALYVGDSETDVQTARAAGVPVLVVTYGYAAVPADQLGADGVVDSIAALESAAPVLVETR